MIEARHLKKVYAPKKGVTVNALDDVSLRLPDTGMVFILGKSGSGKSTLLNVLGGLDTVDSGEIIIKGQSSSDFKQSHFDSYRNTYVGFIFQEYNILEEFTVGANIALAIELQGRKATNGEINEILHQVELDGLGSRKPNELSGGQKQRVAIARALVKKPEIIMADEPTGALDSVTGRQVFDTLKKLSKTKLVLIVSHDREFSELYADRIIELSDGKIISDVEYDEETEITEEPNVAYVGKEIIIKDGYELTEEDRIAINEYIRKVRSTTSIIINDKRQNKIFKPTDENKIENKGGIFKLIKSRLSLKNAFKLGSSGLKHKKVRLVFTIFLSFIAFSLFGLADTIASYNSINTCTESLIDSKIDYASFVKEIKYIYDESDPSDFYWNKWNNQISKDEVSILEEQTGLRFTPVLGGDSINLYYTKEVAETVVDRYDWSRIYPDNFSGVAILDEELISNFGYTISGKAPVEKNEIVISKFIAENYVRHGFLQYNDKTDTSDIVKINSANDMIGKEITVEVNWNMPTQKYKIVGILDTKFDSTRYEALADTTSEDILNMIIYEELESSNSYSLNAVMFITPALFDEINSAVNANRQNVRNGNFEFFTYKDKNASLDDGNYESWPTYCYNLHKLAQINTSKVHWLTDAPVSALGKFDIILSISDARMLLSSSDHIDEESSFAPYDITLSGVECDYALNYIGNYSFDAIQNSIDNVAAYAYAKENYDEALSYIKKISPAFNENDYLIFDEALQDNVINKDYIAYLFSGLAVENGCDLYDAKAFYEALMEKYKITDDVITYEQYSKRRVYFPDGSCLDLFYSISRVDYDRSRYDYLFADLASETFAQAVENAKNATEKPSWYSEHTTHDKDGNEVTAPNYNDCFWNYRQQYNAAANGEQTSLSISEIERVMTIYTEYVIEDFKKASPNLAIKYESYGNNHITEESKDARVVGFTTEPGVKVVVGDEIFALLVDELSMGDYSYVVAPMPTDRAGVRSIAEFSYTNSHYDEMARFSLENSVTYELEMIDEALLIMGQVFLYVGLGFAIFASLMLSNFIATSISYKKQDIGILRAIGSRSRDVFMIFFAESFIIAMINFVLSLVTTGVVVFFLNSIFREDLGILITFLTFGVRQAILLLGASLLVAIIATFLPVKKIASMKPIDAIKNRK